MLLFKSNLSEENNHLIEEFLTPSEIPQLDSSFTERVMIRVKREKMKPRYIFTLGKWSLKVGVAFSLILSIWSVNAFWYSLKSSGALVFTEFGLTSIEVRQIILSNLSYFWITLTLAGFVSAIYLTRHQFLFLKKSFAVTLLGLFLFINLSGLTLAFSGGNEYIQDKIVTEEVSIPGLNHYYKNQAQFKVPTSQHLLGQIKEVREESVIVETPYQEEIILPLEKVEKAQARPTTTEPSDKEKVTPQPKSEIISQFKKGDFIIGLGEKKDGIFSPKDIQIKSPSKEYQRFFPEYYKQKMEEQKEKLEKEWKEKEEKIKKEEFPLEKGESIPWGSSWLKILERKDGD